MQRYKALEDLGVKPEDCYTNWMVDGEKEDKHYNDWLKEKEEYGIDERYTWNWSDDFMDYMYIHLEMFNRVNIVAFDKEFVEFDGQTVSVQQSMDTILEWFRTRYYPKKLDTIDFENYEDKDKWQEDLKTWCNEKHKIIQLFAEIIEHLNW